MSIEKKELYYNSGKCVWFWNADHNDSLHLRMAFTFDHRVDGEQLKAAWEQTMKVYPLLACIPDRVDGDLVFYQTDAPMPVIESEAPIMPMTDLGGQRAITLSWFKDTITLIAYHSVMDGNGMISVARTLIWAYCCIHFGESFDPGSIVTKEGRAPREYYLLEHDVKLGEYNKVPPVTFPEGVRFFEDEEMVPADGGVVSGCLSVPSDQFIRMCRANGANPSAMLCLLFGRAVYRQFPEEKKSLALALTMDSKPYLGLAGSIGHGSGAMILTADRDEVTAPSSEEIIRRLRRDINAQRTEDYVKSMTALTRTYDLFNTSCSGVISYEGALDFGACSGHVTEMFMVNNTCNTLHVTEFGGRFLLFFQFGKATGRYMEALKAEMEKLGVQVKTEREPAVPVMEITEQGPGEGMTMANENEKVIHKAAMPVAINPFWKADCEGLTHMTLGLTLNHEIRGDLLLEAYKETLEVWPLLKDAFVLEDNGLICFEENPWPVEIHHSSTIVAPGAGRNHDRLLAVTYDENKVWFSGMHSYFDGGSLLLIMRGTICRYMEKYLGRPVDCGPLPEAGDAADPNNYEFYMTDPNVAAMPYTYRERVKLHLGGFRETDMVRREERYTSLYELTMPASAFMAACRSCGANPSVMLFLVFAKALYRLYPETTAPVTAYNTMNIRHALGKDLAIMGQTLEARLGLTREDLEERPLEDLVRELRASMKEQREKDYMLSRIEDLKKGRRVEGYRATVYLAYLGEFDYGKDCMNHIRSISGYASASTNIDLVAIHNVFKMFIQLGMAGKRYTEAMCEVLNEMHVPARITAAFEALPDETRE